MFDIGASELLIIAVVAILVIGPKDMPLALRTAGRWIGQIRKVSAHFRAGIDAMVRDATETGADGARITGAGFGGCFVCLIAAEHDDAWWSELQARHPGAKRVA